jgi:hypothetical protein
MYTQSAEDRRQLIAQAPVETVWRDGRPYTRRRLAPQSS